MCYIRWATVIRIWTESCISDPCWNTRESLPRLSRALCELSPPSNNRRIDGTTSRISTWSLIASLADLSIHKLSSSVGKFDISASNQAPLAAFASSESNPKQQSFIMRGPSQCGISQVSGRVKLHEIVTRVVSCFASHATRSAITVDPPASCNSQVLVPMIDAIIARFPERCPCFVSKISRPT
jgi:hypothetical protein